MRIRRTVFAFLLMVGALPLALVRATGTPSGFVTADGPNLFVDGQPWNAIGVNFWDMEPYKALGNDLSGCYYQRADIDAYFDASFRRISQDMKATVVRTFGFREQYTAGGRDYAAADKLLYYAQKYNVRVIPVLGDQFAACGIPGRGLDWYHCEGECVPGYKKPTVWGTDYRSYVVNTVSRYKDNPTIAFWQLMNEPLYAVRDQQVAPNVILPFTRDIVSAIRDEAGDTNHLINTGTAQGAYGNQQLTALLLDCPVGGNGGCTDLAEAHDYGGAPLNGAPLPSLVGASLVVSNSYDNDIVTYPIAAPIDGWTQMKTSAKHNGQPDLYWSILLKVPPSQPWRLYIDDAIATTIAGPAVYSFETDSQGFTAEGATVSRTMDIARTGFASLAVDVPAGVSQVKIKPPILPAPHQSVEAWIRLRFDAPAPDYGRSTASMLHAAVVSRNKPFFIGEAGIAAQVPDSTQIAPLFKPECARNVTLAQRATMFDTMLATQTDTFHRSSGIIVWDWKDPSQMWTAPDGSLIPDKGVGCYTLTPGDPSIDVLATWNRKTTVPPLPPPGSLPDPVTTLVMLKGPPANVGAGSTFPVQVRVTHGGNPVRNFTVTTSGVCPGSGKTDAIGVANFTCKVTTEQGGGSVVLEPDPTCDCEGSAIETPVFVGRSIKAGALAGVVERGNEAPITVLLTSSDGKSLQGTTWTLPECGRTGVITANATSASVQTFCPTAGLPVSGALPLRVYATDSDGIVSASIDTLLVFDRVYVDDASRDCIGLAVNDGWIGALEAAGSCTPGSFGTPGQWFAFQVPAANRNIAFRSADTKLIVTAAQGGSSNRKVAGVFEYATGPSRAFTAVASGRDGSVRALQAG